jgi:hypothetical protein
MSTAVVRVDLFQTADGAEEMQCACDAFRPCLYHWYYEVKMDGAPTPTKRKEKMDEQFPGRKPQRVVGASPGKPRGKVGDSGVRRDGSKAGNRSGKPVRGKGRRG